MNQLNSLIFSFLNGFAGYSKLLDFLIVFCAIYLPYIISAYAILLLYIAFRKRHAGINPRLYFKKSLLEIVLLVDSIILSWLMSWILKVYIAAPRPFLEGITPLFYHGGYTSFPSGHATVFAALTVSAFMFHKRQGYVFLIAALLIGIARIMAGVHYPIDIFAGYCVGIIGAWLMQRLLRDVEEKVILNL